MSSYKDGSEFSLVYNAMFKVTTACQQRLLLCSLSHISQDVPVVFLYLIILIRPCFSTIMLKQSTFYDYGVTVEIQITCSLFVKCKTDLYPSQVFLFLCLFFGLSLKLNLLFVCFPPQNRWRCCVFDCRAMATQPWSTWTHWGPANSFATSLL